MVLAVMKVSVTGLVLSLKMVPNGFCQFPITIAGKVVTL